MNLYDLVIARDKLICRIERLDAKAREKFGEPIVKVAHEDLLRISKDKLKKVDKYLKGVECPFELKDIGL